MWRVLLVNGVIPHRPPDGSSGSPLDLDPDPVAPLIRAVAAGGLLHLWELGLRQSSFRRITRTSRGGSLGTSGIPPLCRHAVVPSAFRLQVSRLVQERSLPNSSRLCRGSSIK